MVLNLLHRDYRGLKKKITAIRRAQEAASDPDTDGDTPFLPLSPSISRPAEGADEHGSVPSTPTRTAHFDIDDKRTSTSSAPATLPAGGDGAPITTSEPTRTPPRLRRRMTGPSARSVSSSHHSTAHDGPPGTPASPSTANPKTRAPWPWAPGAHPPLRELLPRLPPVARSFFDMLDGELDKVESFYCARERELKTRFVSRRAVCMRCAGLMAGAGTRRSSSSCMSCRATAARSMCVDWVYLYPHRCSCPCL